MIPPVRLLVATDFSAGADCAATAAIELASRWGGRIDWVHASPEAPHSLTPSSDALLADWVAREHREARDALAALRERASDRDVESDVHRVDGRLDATVAGQAKQLASDWVVIGTHGQSGIQSMLIGSSAEKIVRASPCPTLSVRLGAPLGGGTVVFGEDFQSAEFRETAVAVARSLDSRLVAVHAIEPATSVVSNAAFAVPPALVGSSTVEAHERFAALASAYGDDVECVVALGDAAGALCDAARRHNGSLVVTGSSTRTGFDRWMLGSVAERALRHAPCSVLTLK